MEDSHAVMRSSLMINYELLFYCFTKTYADEWLIKLHGR